MIKTGDKAMVIRGAVSFRVTVIETRGAVTLIETRDGEVFEVATSDLHRVEAR